MLRYPRPKAALACWLLVTCGLAACAPLVPARVPAHIKHTPGALVVVTDRQLDAGAFRLESPPTWSVTKASPATADYIHVFLTAPDGGAVSLQQVAAVESATDEHLILPSGVIIKVSIEPATGSSAAFSTQAKQIYRLNQQLKLSAARRGPPRRRGFAPRIRRDGLQRGS